VIKELTQSKRKNKLLARNPDLENLQNATTLKKAVAAEQAETPKKKNEAKKRVEVTEPTNVVEVVYDDSARPPEEDGEVVEQKPMTDLEWLRSHMSRTFGLVSDSEESETEEKKEEENDSSNDEEDEKSEVPTPATPPATEHSDAEEEEPPPKTSAVETKILKTGRLFVRNLVYGVTEEDLREIFSPFGQLEEVFPHRPCVSLQRT